jgi:hypothetical protein
VNIHDSDNGQIEIRTAEPLLPGPNHPEVETATAKLKEYKLPSSGQILAKLIQTGDITSLSVIHKLFNSMWNKDELPNQWRDSIILPIHKNGDKAVCKNDHGIITAINFI